MYYFIAKYILNNIISFTVILIILKNYLINI